MADCAQRGYWRSQGNPSLGSNHLPGVRSHYSGPSKGNDAGSIKRQLHFVNIVSIKNVFGSNFEWKFDSKHSKLEQQMFLFFKFIYAFIFSRQKPLTNTKKESKQQHRQVLKRQKMLRHLASSRAIFRFHFKEYLIIFNILKRIDHTNENGQVT